MIITAILCLGRIKCEKESENKRAGKLKNAYFIMGAHDACA